MDRIPDNFRWFSSEQSLVLIIPRCDYKIWETASSMYRVTFQASLGTQNINPLCLPPLIWISAASVGAVKDPCIACPTKLMPELDRLFSGHSFVGVLFMPLQKPLSSRRSQKARKAHSVLRLFCSLQFVNNTQEIRKIEQQHSSPLCRHLPTLPY